MRVTNKMLSNNFLSDMGVNLENMRTLQQQMTSGKNFKKPSDDPFNVARSMQMHTSINANAQYNKNINNTINWMDNTDTALGQLNNVFQTIRERMVSAGNAAYGSDDRKKIKDELNQRIGQISQILDTSFDGEYIFGGTKGSTKPVNAKVEYTIPGIVGKSDKTMGDAMLTGAYTGGSSALNYKIQITQASSGHATEVQYCTDGVNWSSPPTTISADGDFDIGNGLKVKLSDAAGNTTGSTYNFSINQDQSIIYCKNDGTEMNVKDVSSGKVTVSNWSEQTIKFNVSSASNSTGTDAEIKLSKFTASQTTDDVVKDINDKINTLSTGTPPTYPLKGKIVAEKTEDGKIAFRDMADSSSESIKISDTTVSDLTSAKDIKVPSMQFDMIQAKRQTEISQGVLATYNVSATDVIKYGSDDKDDIRMLLNRVVNHLNGMVEKKDSNGNILKDDKGNIIYTADTVSATNALTNDDLKDVDKAMAQILKVRSQVGAMQNRMDSALDQNEASNLDMSEILSKTEDIDITEKTMEYATMQTVYLASLQTSAKVLQPTLMDYMR